jgi:hypothetical protein
MDDKNRLNKVSRIATKIFEGIDDKQAREKVASNFFKPDKPLHKESR